MRDSTAETLLITVGPIASWLIHSAVDTANPSGSLVLPEISLKGLHAAPHPRDAACWIFQSGSLLVASIGFEASPERCHAVAKSLLQEVAPRASRVIIASQLSVGQLRGGFSLDSVDRDGVVFALDSEAEQKSNKSNSFGPLPPGNLVSGLAAAVLSQCQVSGRRCRLLVSLQLSPSPLDPTCARALARALDSEVPTLEVSKAAGSAKAASLASSSSGLTNLFT